MTAWQYLAGAGLVAALCPLYGHVAVAGDGHGRGARIDLCVPGGPHGHLVVRPPAPDPSGRPAVRPTAPGPGRPTVHHPGRTPLPAAPPPPPAPTGRPAPAPPPEPDAGDAKPPEAGPDAAAAVGPTPAPSPAPARAAPVAARVSAFHVRPYRAVALQRRTPGGLSTVMLMTVVTTPAVLAAAALRPGSRRRG
ncbi:hypothetical protein AB0P12_01175 [Streptomyces subrutilus]|uniref:hypothetical protein n=1 Tax=Streptomyces subrutilus TaxID=36818 RepID=UPI003424CD88